MGRPKLDKTEFAKEFLIKNNLTYLDKSPKPLTHRDYVYYICNKHSNKEELKVRMDYLQINKFLCKFCMAEHFSETYSGENSHSWKGGLTDVRIQLRHAIASWNRIKIEQSNFRCDLTGKSGSLEVHHLENFESIVNKIAHENDIELNNITQIELDKLKEKVLNYHMENMDIGIVLADDIHKRFHKIYGLKNTTKEQFDEFKKSHRYRNDNINNDSIEKKNASSKYMGVWLRNLKIGKRYCATISNKNKLIYLGTFLTEYRAAKAYNDKAKELYGKYAILNNLSGLSDYWVYEDSYYRFKTKGTSIYTGVHFSKSNWRYEIIEDRKRIFSGTCDSELEAAYLYNKKKVELLGENVILNFLSDEEIKSIEENLILSDITN